MGLAEAPGNRDGRRAIAAARAPFDIDRLDALLEGAGVDVVVATSPHNVRYLLGSYSRFHASFDAIGVDRYLPAVVLRRGAVDDAFAVAADIDADQHAVEPPWVPTLLDVSQSTTETARIIGDRLHALGLARATLAIEQSFAPQRFVHELANALPGANLVEAASLLEELRAIKRNDELALLCEAAQLIVDAIVAAAVAGAGETTAELADRLRLEEECRGLRFEYCLVAAGPNLNRAPSAQRWERGSVLSLDSGGRRHGYIGDLCRMAVSGPSTSRQDEVLAQVRHVQDVARQAVKPGATGDEIYAAAAQAIASVPDRDAIGFFAHGMGLVPHEAPRLSEATPIRYPASHHDRPLEPGMVLSVETDARVDGVGLVKLEDTIAVTAVGFDAFGDTHRDWIVAGSS